MLELKDVSYHTSEENNQEKHILKNINLTVNDGEMWAVTGPNGGGKSTLARIIVGIIKPTSGTILYNGIDITDFSISERAKLGVSFAFQQPVRFKGIKVKDLIKLSAGNDINTNGACEYLSEVGLCAKEYINREVDASLSGGELKRIEIANIIARNTNLSIFDEPEAGIDLWSFNNLVTVFKKMHEKKDKSIVIISHQERILNIADKILLIADGELVKSGLREEILPELLSDSNDCIFCKKI